MKHPQRGCPIGRRGFLKLSAAVGVAGLSAEAWGMIGSGYEEPEVTAELRRRALEGDLPRRPLGKTGVELTIIGFGGFHLLEVSEDEAERLLDFYLDAGGNFIETAMAYGNGDSERKIGRVMARRRDECFLSTKVYWRDKANAARSINESLENLQTDHVDNLFMHGVSTFEDLDKILSDDGALRAAEEAREAGKVRCIGITSHLPEVLLKAVQAYHFDAVMEWINYLDFMNFPLIPGEIIPACTAQGTGVVCMKPIADGLLWRSATDSFRWVWSQPEVTSAATGNNTMYQLASNLSLAKHQEPMSDEERNRVRHEAPELANYVCRQCHHCMPNAAGLNIPAIHCLEGYYDRQMMPGPVMDLPDKDIRNGLSNWFGNREWAKARYAEMDRQVPGDVDCSDAEQRCPFHLPITAKLKWVHQKLTGQAG
jgi:predicted aldo/keto reductase-like oxidoreductase